MKMEAQFEQAVKSLHENGIGVIHEFLTPEELNEFREELDKLVKLVEQDWLKVRDDCSIKPEFTTGRDQRADKHFLESVDKLSYFFEADTTDDDTLPSVNKIAHGLHVRNELFARFCKSDRLKQLAKLAGMKAPRLTQSMLLMKNAVSGSEVTVHKDATFLYTEPTVKMLGIWIPLLDCDKENGCLQYVPGSHRDTRCRRWSRKCVLSSDQLSTTKQTDDSECVFINEEQEQKYEQDQFVYLQVPAGSCILIDAFVTHKSDANRSKRSRPAFALHLVDLPEGVTWCEGNWMQETSNYKFPSLFT